MRYRVGVDTGGTFTDVVLFDETSDQLYVTKTHSTPANPAMAVINGINKIAALHNLNTRDIDFLVHGTTVATNALLEYKGVETAILLTGGFKDILSIARQTRPKMYDWFVKRPEPFIPRHLRYEVSERMDYTGAVIKTLDEDQVRSYALELKKRNIRSIAVCLLHSYANPMHEQKIREIILRHFPSAKVCVSSDVLREIREFERMSTTVINAYVMPIIEDYLAFLVEQMKERSIGAELNIMQSNGGIMTADTAARKSVSTILSGPAGGVIGCMAVAEQTDVKNYITIDMGGTSFDLSLIYDGKVNLKTESEIVGHPINAPILDIHTIGAGGGSIAWIDRGGALRVGPQSAGADPGPACYGLGGREPTVTDANLVLGRLNPVYYLGGEVGVNVEAAQRAINDKIAQPLGLSLEKAAEGILKVINATMVRGIRAISVEKGYDPREFSIISFGGAGSLHAVDLAKELEISEIIIPLYPGANSAVGLLIADFRYDYSGTFLARIDELDLDELNKAYQKLENEALGQMERERIAGERIRLIRSVDMRYLGQAFELNIPVPGGVVSSNDLTDITTRFHQEHKKLFGYNRLKEPTQFVFIRLSAVALIDKPRFAQNDLSDQDASPALKGSRATYLDGRYTETSIYERGLLRTGNILTGPAIIEQFDTTILVMPDQRVCIDKFHNIRINCPN